MPARDAVKGARYEAVGVARLVFQVPELNKSILEIVPGAYGEAKKALRSSCAAAEESMDQVVERWLGASCQRVEQSVASEPERRSAGGSKP